MKKFIVGLIILISTGACSQPSPVEKGFNYQIDWYNQSTNIMEDSNFPRYISWEDNIFNHENYEYLVEVLFQNNLVTPIDIDATMLQYLFVCRYYDCCTDNTRQWYDWYKEYKGY